MVPRTDPDNLNLDVVSPRLISIADEMAVTLVQTAFSHDVIEVRDMSTAVFDARGYLIAQAPLGATGHIGSMPPFMTALLRAIPPESMQPGDVYICNDPWVGNGHTADIFITVPAFREGRLLGFTISTVHHMDVGGRSGSGLAETVYEEGLIMPFMRLYRAGRVQEDLLRLIQRNVRYSEKVIGDLHAQIAACHLGARRMLELVEEQNLESLQSVSDEIITRTEIAMRMNIRELPDGIHSTALEIDNRDETGSRLRIALTLKVMGDELWADFTGTSAQVRRPINCPTMYVNAYVVLAAKMVCDPRLPNNEGSFRPIHTSAPEGCLFNPTFPAPTFWRISSGLMAADLMFRALGQVVPDRVPADSGCLPTWQLYFSGHRLSGAPFVLHQHAFGGMGARPGKDGLASISFPYNSREVSTEGCEIETPLLIERRELIADSGGPGRWRGGLGEKISIRRAPGSDIDPNYPIVCTGGVGRLSDPAQGMLGGQPGALAKILLDGHELEPSQISNSPSFHFTDETLTLCLPGGGGYGDPRDRDPDAIQRDLDNGYISEQAARQVYGYDATGRERSVDQRVLSPTRPSQ